MRAILRTKFGGPEVLVIREIPEPEPKAGYAVIQADGSRQAMLALEARGEIHLLFTDVQMPGDIDGLQLARLVRRRWPCVRVLVTSGQYPVTQEEMPSGGRFLSKPYVAAEVVRQVDELLAA